MNCRFQIHADCDYRKVIVANAGDSRCVLARAGNAVALSEDHKPENQVELARITAAGSSKE